jgi:hypothetical protein
MWIGRDINRVIEIGKIVSGNRAENYPSNNCQKKPGPDMFQPGNMLPDDR